MIWFAAVTVLALIGLRGAAGSGPAAELSRRVSGYMFALSIPGLSVVLYLAYASFFVLKAYCVFCLVTYFAVIGIFLISGAAADGIMTGLHRRAFADLRALVTSPVGLGLALAFGAGAIALVALFPRQVDAVAAASAAAAAPIRALETAEQSNFDQRYASLPRVPLAVPTDGAKVLIVKFNDYQCPPCRMTWEQYKPVIAKYMAQYPGKVKFVTKDYPLDGECNVNTPGAGHAAACEAAVAVRLARAKGRADAMEAWLFANQQQITPDLVRTGRAQRWRRHGLRGAVRQDARTGEDRHRPWRVGQGHRHADFLRQRRQGADGQARVLRRRDCLRAEALRRLEGWRPAAEVPTLTAGP